MGDNLCLPSRGILTFICFEKLLEREPSFTQDLQKPNKTHPIMFRKKFITLLTFSSEQSPALRLKHSQSLQHFPLTSDPKLKTKFRKGGPSASSDSNIECNRRLGKMNLPYDRNDDLYSSSEYMQYAVGASKQQKLCETSNFFRIFAILFESKDYDNMNLIVRTLINHFKIKSILINLIVT